MLDDINKEFERKHLAGIRKVQQQVKEDYQKAIDRIYKEASQLKARGNAFSITDYPEFNKKVDQFLKTFHDDVTVTLNNGIKGKWELSMEKNATVIHKNYKKIIDDIDRMVYDPQSAALEQFIKRQVGGLGLSDRVWKYTNQFQAEIEQNLYVGVQAGTPAAEMARDQTQYLEQPDKLFRRVRDAEGVLRLSKAAKEYKPGQGIYRSSYKNAMRLTRDTVNDSYRQADMVRYQSLPFVLGYDVNLSNSHPRVDICDDLQGLYPKTFVWLKWHNQCLCGCTSRLASPAEFYRYQDAILAGTADKFIFTGTVNSLPTQFKTYVSSNQGTMDGWKRKPDWVTMNNVKI